MFADCTFWLLSVLLLLLLLASSHGNSNQWLQAVCVLCKLCNCNTSMITIKFLSMTLYLQSLYYFGFVICTVEPVSIKVYSNFGNSFLHSGLKITAGQRTMSGLIVGLTGQTLALPVILTGHFWMRTFYNIFHIVVA